MSGGTDTALAQAARATEAATREALAWVEAARPMLRAEAEPMARDLRRFARRARRLTQAAERPMAVAVFGPSQSGKSYLISALARRGTEPVLARFGQTRLDFVKDINPEGGQEATGLITRFTLRPAAAPEGAPVPLRLLSQADVIRILANTFLEDFDPAEVPLPAPEAVAEHLSRMAARAGAARDRFDADEAEELREYVETEFRGHPLVAALGAGFWPQATALAPALSPSDRAELYAPLWNGEAAFTGAARRLLSSLSALGDPDEAFCGTEALVPREASIIDVRTLSGLSAPEAAGEVLVATRAGRRISLPRPVLAALVAELTIPLEERPWPFLEVTDLLDFPGARSRERLSDPSRFLAEPGRFPGLYLRGKVAYLWQRTVAEQEATAMLLCIGPSNQEVRTLPRMVKAWIDSSMGSTPEARAQQRNALFLVLTKFDTEFEEKRGQSEGTGSRWTIRLNASLLDFFGKEHSWPREWTPGRPFNNTLWLRNPNVAAKHILDTDETGLETGIRPSEAARIGRLRAEFLANEDVRRHFADPEAAWDAALSLNDGGITHLAEKLAAVCDPEVKRAQVQARLAELRAAIRRRLAPFWHSGDAAAEAEKRRAAARAVAKQLVSVAARQNFGRLLKALTIPPEALSGLWWRLQTEPEDAAPIGARPEEAEYLAELGELVAPSGGAASRPRDAEARFAEAAIAEWIADMTDDLLAPNAEALIGLKPEAAAVLVDELAQGARRLGLAEQLAERLRALALYRRKLSDGAARPVLIAETLINGFVAALGQDQLPPEARVRAGRDQHPVFAPRPPVEGLPPLGPEPAPYDKTLHVDWITAFSALVAANAAAGSGDVDWAANARLGEVLRALEGPGA
ncbi:MAG: virulence factor SrfC family protein [Acetobacteraceae bacterium]|nr:virulence factor SrfC family protein [Acetobacteraceae bacterium]